ncbi:MAG: ribbon-helix-helix protein, CopG family [Lachnospiraceae bacterium]|nr:ribbon-helix-helix protein, CopG family [Lachnospiraceae bacterium]
MSPKMGQKLTDNPKDTTVRARMDAETVRKLDCLASEQNSDRSKIIRQGIEIQYEQRNKK